MRGGILSFVVILGFAAAATPLTAQGNETQPAPLVTADSSALPSAVSTDTTSRGPVHVSIGVGFRATEDHELLALGAQEAQGGVKGFFFGTRRRTSNTLMIGGVGLALVGVSVVKGHAGAIMGMAGLLSSIGGLYLAF